MTIASGITLHEAELAEICRRYSVKALSVFGSAARGELRPDSDIDLLVEFHPDAPIGLIEHIAAQRELSELLGRPVDPVSRCALRSELREPVLADAKTIYAA
jgi:predicted nucleotidyltransferase